MKPDEDPAVINGKSGDDLAREAAGRPHPEPGHDVRDYRQYGDPSEAEGPDVERRLAEALERLDKLERKNDG